MPAWQSRAAPPCVFNKAAHSNVFWEGIWGLTQNSTCPKPQVKFNMILLNWPLYIWFEFCCFFIMSPPFHPPPCFNFVEFCSFSKQVQCGWSADVTVAVSVGQESRHGSAESLAQVLIRPQSRYQPGCVLIWRVYWRIVCQVHSGWQNWFPCGCASEGLSFLLAGSSHLTAACGSFLCGLPQRGHSSKLQKRQALTSRKVQSLQ